MRLICISQRPGNQPAVRPPQATPALAKLPDGYKSPSLDADKYPEYYKTIEARNGGALVVPKTRQDDGGARKGGV